jgi:hypothetical protein
MPRFGPIKRRELIHYLRALDFEGPYSGGKHQFMIKDVFYEFPILIKVTSVKNSFPEFSGKQKLVERCGRDYRGV